jgi:CheY-like chemotaxis protein
METTSPLQSTRKIQARILIVDDHPATAETLARALSQLSPELEVISDTSAKSALERVKNSAVDLVITDMMMPEMNGLELIDKLRQHPGGRPSYTILVTAYDVPGLKEMTRRMKVNETLIKPIHPERIREVVGKFLDEMQNSLGSTQAYSANESFKILIADDKPDNVALLSRYLHDKGYVLSKAADGVDALEKVYAELPDLVLLDINMPKKDGFAVLHEMRADPRISHIPVIILTANRLDTSDIQTGLNMGADDYVSKPFDRRELMARIQTKLRVKSAEDNIRRRNKELNILIETAKIMTSRNPLDQILDDVLRSIVDGLNGQAAYFIDFEKGKSRSQPEYGLEVDLSGLKDTFIQNEVMQDSIIMDDIHNDTRWLADLHSAARSVIWIPTCRQDGRLLRAFIVTHEETAYFRPDQIDLLQAVANQTALALETAHLQIKSD